MSFSLNFRYHPYIFWHVVSWGAILECTAAFWAPSAPLHSELSPSSGKAMTECCWYQASFLQLPQLETQEPSSSGLRPGFSGSPLVSSPWIGIVFEVVAFGCGRKCKRETFLAATETPQNKLPHCRSLVPKAGHRSKGLGFLGTWVWPGHVFPTFSCLSVGSHCTRFL